MKRLLLCAALALILPLSACMGGGLGDAQRGDGNNFTVAWNAQPPTLDPLMTTSTATRDISRNFFEPLITLDSENNVEPVLAKSVSLSDDGMLVEFELRTDVKFHDGSMMEASDVVASLNAWIEKASVGQLFFSEAEVTSPAKDRVEIRLPDPLFIALTLLADQGQLPGIQPKEILEAAGPDPVEEFIGTGPYMMKKWNTDQYVQLARFDDYVSPTGETDGTAGERRAAFDNIFFYFVNDPSTRMSGLQTGEYDAANALPPDNIGMLEGDDNISVTTGDNGFNAAIFNKKTGVMSDPDMRRAVLAATNIDDIQKAAFSQDKLYDTNGALMPESSEWYSTEGLDDYNSPDPERVAELLKKADYDGEQVRILTSREYEEHYNNAVVMNQELNEVGINSRLIVTDWATVLQNRTDESSYEIFITGFSPTSTPLTQVFFDPVWPGWTESPQIEDAFDKVIHAPSSEKAVSAKDDLQKAFYDYLPVLKFGGRTTTTGIRSGFSGHEFTSASGDIFYNVHPNDR
jgi:peptide/nickel transport system substrate-binding protein